MRMTNKILLVLIILGISVTGCFVKPFSGMHSEEIRTEVNIEIIGHAVEAMVDFVPREETFLSVVEVWEKNPIRFGPDEHYSAIECHLVKVVATVDLSTMTIDSIGCDSISIVLQSPILNVSTQRTNNNRELNKDNYEADQISRLSANTDIEVSEYFSDKEEDAEIVNDSKDMTEMLLQELIGSWHEGIYIVFMWE